MIIKKITLSLSLLVILTACGQSNQPKLLEKTNQDKISINFGEKAITTKSLTQHIKILSSDKFGGRAPGSEGEELTVNYIASEFKKFGVAPGNGNSYFQEVPLTSVEAINKPSILFSDGKSDDLTLTYSNEQVVWTRKQINSVEINNSEVIFVGYGINAPERNWNDYADIDVTGKTVVMLVNDPGYATQDSSLFNGNAMTYYGRWDYKFDEAARQGAAAAIIIHDTKPAAYGWSTVSSSWTGPQFDMVRADQGSELASMEGWITLDSAKALFNKSGLDLTAQYIAAKTPGFKAVPLNLTVSATIENKTTTINSKNVVGFIKGSESPDEVFIYMAHWDHLGTDPVLQKETGDGIYNGALDNATGTVGLIELAKAYASMQEKPKRSVLFLAVTAEEQGLLGSAYYASNPLYSLAKTVGGINMDGLNNFGPTKDVTVIGSGMSELENILEKNAKAKNRILNPDSEAEKGYFYRSDHFELSKLGVPMLYPNSGYDHVDKGVAYGIEKAEEYTKKHYHGPSDEYQDDWILTGAVEDLQLYFLTGSEIVNSNAWPQWNEGTEFKAIRDAQRGK
ncbi:M28 family metallopeptidase [Colwellia sp. MSW7]|uniref:M28 family metallopeptidase n=1 Tax=Colwellia maritima TaxID=2912588 RepID=A0ABS9X0W5_9GAMM|nr:M28 family metallopeptidase [Colwellia maritima]MCI2283831.1 M28 family metallopeptidase [Colwellia maritima]